MGNTGKIVRTIRKANGLTQRELASTMEVTQPYISLIERGIQTPTPMFIKLFCLLSMGAARQATAQAPKICLNVRNTVDIEQTARIAHVQKSIALIYGPAGCGKSTALKHYVSTTHGAIYVEADATVNTVRSILKLILAAIGGEARGSTADLMQCILAKLKGTSQLLILDEAQHLSERSFDAIRAINDKAHIGIVYTGNPSVLRRMYGRKAEEFDQVFSRTTYKCCLNNAFTKSDISAIYEEFNFRPCFKNGNA